MRFNVVERGLAFTDYLDHVRDESPHKLNDDAPEPPVRIEMDGDEDPAYRPTYSYPNR